MVVRRAWSGTARSSPSQQPCVWNGCDQLLASASGVSADDGWLRVVLHERGARGARSPSRRVQNAQGGERARRPAVLSTGRPADHCPMADDDDDFLRAFAQGYSPAQLSQLVTPSVSSATPASSVSAKLSSATPAVVRGKRRRRHVCVKHVSLSRPSPGGRYATVSAGYEDS